MGRGFLVAAALALLSSSARAGWWDDLDKGERARLMDVIAQPKTFVGKRITFVCVYHKQDQVFAPYFTRFRADKHLNTCVWPDGKPVWEQQAFVADFPHLYLDRAHVQRDELLSMPTFTRLEVTGEVKDVYRNQPWIEIHGLRKTGGTLGNEVVQSMMAGDNHVRASDLYRAEGKYRQALEDPALAEPYVLLVRKRLGDLLRASGRVTEAAEVEGGTILGGSSLPRPDGSAPPPTPPPREEPQVPPAQAPGPVSGTLPGIPVDPASPPGATTPPSEGEEGAPPSTPKRAPRLSGVK